MSRPSYLRRGILRPSIFFDSRLFFLGQRNERFVYRNSLKSLFKTYFEKMDTWFQFHVEWLEKLREHEKLERFKQLKRFKQLERLEPHCLLLKVHSLRKVFLSDSKSHCFTNKNEFSSGNLSINSQNTPNHDNVQQF
jgi:hypothetical protein